MCYIVFIFKRVVKGIFNRLFYIFIYLFRNLEYQEFGWGSVVRCPLKVTPHLIRIGRRVSVFDNARIEGIVKYNDNVYNPLIILHDDVHIEQGCHITCAENVEIGNNTAIAANVTITDIHHPYDDIMLPIEKHDLVVKPVKIGADCKIYNNTVILQGISIGNHVTVAANSVVTTSFPDNCVVGGAPAYIIKKYDCASKQWRRTDRFGQFL